MGSLMSWSWDARKIITTKKMTKKPIDTEPECPEEEDSETTKQRLLQKIETELEINRLRHLLLKSMKTKVEKL